MKRFFVTICFAVVSYTMFAQADIDSVKSELYKINKVFDSSGYLGFDINIVYSTDTILGKFEHDEMNGKYIVNNHNVYYRMGNIEYAQNDSFVYNIYHDEKMMVMTKVGSVTPVSSVFPLRQFVDSIVNQFDTAYTITMSYDADSNRIIRFVANQPGLPYNRFALYYEKDSRYLDKFEMSFYEGLEEMSDVPDSIAQLIRVKQVTKTVTMNFSNYYSPETLDVFDDGSYVSFDRLRKRYLPAEKFKGYRFLANGVNGEQEDDSIELYPPPTSGN